MATSQTSEHNEGASEHNGEVSVDSDRHEQEAPFSIDLQGFQADIIPHNF